MLSKRLFSAARSNDNTVVQKILEINRHLIFEVDDRGQTLIHVAVRREYSELLLYLLLLHGPKNQRDKIGLRPLDIATQNGSQEIVKVISP